MQNLRLAFRSLKETPIVTVVAILSLALGIGANTAIFSIVDRLVLRSLPVVEPQRLAVISDTRGIKGGFTSTWTADHDLVVTFRPMTDQVSASRIEPAAVLRES